MRFSETNLCLRCLYWCMPIDEDRQQQTLQAGQLWKLESGYVLVVELGKRLVHYKRMQQPRQRAVLTQVIGIETLQRYLREHDAELVG